MQTLEQTAQPYSEEEAQAAIEDGTSGTTRESEKLHETEENLVSEQEGKSEDSGEASQMGIADQDTTESSLTAGEQLSADELRAYAAEGVTILEAGDQLNADELRAYAAEGITILETGDQLSADELRTYAAEGVEILEAGEILSTDELQTHAAENVIILTDDEKLTADVLRQHAAEGVEILEAGEKLSFPELISHCGHGVQIAAVAVMALVIVEAVALVIVSRRKAKAEEKMVQATQNPHSEKPLAQDFLKTETVKDRKSVLNYRHLMNIGRREYQQDSLGATRVQDGVFAVVADGMGGLKDGEKVSQLIVHTMLGDAGNNSLEQLRGNLNRMVAHANDEVNRMLGYTEEYVSGSTLIAALAEPYQFRWISVGDSRIYLYRGGTILQLNREHIYEAELLKLAVNGELGFQEAHSHAKRRSVSSFIGMGKLKYIDEPMRATPAMPGDRLLLTSDGVFNTLTEEEIAQILRSFQNTEEAVRELEAAVLRKKNPYQDNFSSILIDWQES